MEILKISTSVGLFRVPTEDIAYIEASGNYCDVYLFNGEAVTMTFQLHYFVEALEKLRQNFFVRVGKSLIVNKNFVYSINITNQDLKLMDHRMSQWFKLRASKEALGIEKHFGTGEINDYETYRKQQDTGEAQIHN